MIIQTHLVELFMKYCTLSLCSILENGFMSASLLFHAIIGNDNHGFSAHSTETQLRVDLDASQTLDQFHKFSIKSRMLARAQNDNTLLGG